MGSAVPIDVFGYLDYRAFLRDYYEAKKAEGRGFSYRVFSRRAEIRSPNHLKRVADGDRNLSSPMAARYANALRLTGDAARYFIDLVAFNQARSSSERDAAYQRLTGFRGYRRAHQLDLAQAAYHSNWYLPAIRELVDRPDFQEDPAWIAKRLVPPIRTVDAVRALEVLLELGLVQRDADGRLVQGEPVVTTGPETRGHHVARYHRAMMERAAASIDLVSAAERDISSLTFCVGADGLREIKDRVRRFRQELMALATQQDDAQQVVQLNIQLFPLSTRRSDEEDA